MLYLFILALTPLQRDFFEGEPLPRERVNFLSGDYVATMWEPLPERVQSFIRGKSWKDDCPVPITDLVYLQISHWDYEGNVQTGELIVNFNIGERVMKIFAKLFQAKFPIQQMRLVDYYDANDERSMQANNSSAFCSRQIYGTNRFSNHSWGTAIDLNTKVNPYYLPSSGKVFPVGSDRYIDRTQQVQGMIYDTDAVVKAFKEEGFSWGGDWGDRKDWQHFEYPKEEFIPQK